MTTSEVRREFVGQFFSHGFCEFSRKQKEKSVTLLPKGRFTAKHAKIAKILKEQAQKA
jgi:hypothetical protein